jgi:hypothetical protein
MQSRLLHGHPKGGLLKYQKSRYIHEFIEAYKRSTAVSRMIEPIRRI